MVEVDVVVVGGGPAGLSASLALGRACKRVLLCDGGPRRNARAEHLHTFVTRDGTPPEEFRRIGREQLSPYDVAVRQERVMTIAPMDQRFRVTLEGGSAVLAKHVVLATGVMDEPLDLPGMRDAFGHSVFQCPFCHGWEVRDRRWGVLLSSEAMLDFAVMLTGWNPRLVAFTHGAFEISEELRRKIAHAGIDLEDRRIRQLRVGEGGALQGLELVDGKVAPVEVLFVKPKQRLPALVEALGLELNELGYVRVNDRHETSIPGMFAVGDLTTPAQAALFSASAGMAAGASIVHALNVRAKLDHA